MVSCTLVSWNREYSLHWVGQWGEKSLTVRIMNCTKSFWVFLLLDKVGTVRAFRFCPHYINTEVSQESLDFWEYYMHAQRLRCRHALLGC